MEAPAGTSPSSDDAPERVVERDRGAAGRRSKLGAVDWRPWRYALGCMLLTRLALGLVAYGAAWFLSPSTLGAPDQSLTNIWVHWDALRFILIAASGYDGVATPPNSTAFFPLYPLTIRALGAIGFDDVVAALLVSAVGSLVAFAFLYKLALHDAGEQSEEAGQRVGARAVLYLALFPTAVFLIAPYSESLFLAGAIPAFFLARRQRWHLVGIPAAIAVGARFAGVFLLIGLAFEFVRQRDFSFDRIANAVVSLLMALIPLLGYGAYLAQSRGNPFYFFTDQRVGWGRQFVGPFQALSNTLDRWRDGSLSTDFAVAYRLEVVAALVGLGIVIWALSKREWGYAAFMGSTLVVLMTSTEYFSIPRILLTFFPAAVFLSQAGLRRHWLHETLLIVMTPLAAVGVIVYTSGAWFF
jgi:hypothetical protein